MISFVVEGDPVPWERAASNGGRRFTAPRTRAYEQLIADAARRAGATPVACPMRLRLRFFRATAQRCDVDNLAKSIQDALNGVAYQDDSQIEHLDVSKAIDRECPRVEVEVEPLAASAVSPLRPAKPRGSSAFQRDLLALVPPKKRAGLLERRLTRSLRSFR